MALSGAVNAPKARDAINKYGFISESFPKHLSRFLQTHKGIQPTPLAAVPVAHRLNRNWLGRQIQCAAAARNRPAQIQGFSNHLALLDAANKSLVTGGTPLVNMTQGEQLLAWTAKEGASQEAVEIAMSRSSSSAPSMSSASSIRAADIQDGIAAAQESAHGTQARATADPAAALIRAGHGPQ